MPNDFQARYRNHSLQVAVSREGVPPRKQQDQNLEIPVLLDLDRAFGYEICHMGLVSAVRKVDRGLRLTVTGL